MSLEQSNHMGSFQGQVSGMGGGGGEKTKIPEINLPIYENLY